MGERHGDPSLESLLAAAVRADVLDPAAEDRALAAFRAARAARTHDARSRRRDDWRPRAARRGRRSLRATLAALVTSVTLGGVAIASIGSGGTSGDGGDGPRPSHSAPERSAEDSAGTAAPGQGDGSSGKPSERPSSAQDTEAQCRAYDEVESRGKALDSAAWQWLVEAAGGEKNVDAYCAGHTGQPTENPGGPDSRTDKDNAPATPAIPTGPADPAIPTSPADPAIPNKPSKPSEAAEPSQAPGNDSDKGANR
ncbi:hypothetical protein G5C60_43115 [Streptomyces sp. HC44]|uniref:Uncharacterized protein n=1 Tax=Streptomyces scabichelini TaxID=2711217 RepID=A0A6G4VJB9_9ACTN|nr:hypothetical protein [Streptomyces scabichelini]NGO14209.1 hypothetical protein [Streptomyces scabichelini]